MAAHLPVTVASFPLGVLKGCENYLDIIFSLHFFPLMLIYSGLVFLLQNISLCDIIKQEHGLFKAPF